MPLPVSPHIPSTNPTPRFRTVVFDCDSTLSTIEGVDELAVEHRASIAALTQRAMRGEVSLESVYGARLDLIRPDRTALAALALAYIATAIPDARATIRALQAGGVAVHILSGGFRQAIVPFATWLGLSDADVRAVDLHFDTAGQFTGFDTDSPLTRSGGKRTMIETWQPALLRPILLVGDGITDWEARPAVDHFTAFAGVTERPEVTAGADTVLRTLALGPLLDLVFPPTPTLNA
jgi:phosphoserine phosphatase